MGCIYIQERFGVTRLSGRLLMEKLRFVFSYCATFSTFVECHHLTHLTSVCKAHTHKNKAVCLLWRTLQTSASFFLPCRPSMSSFIMFLCEQGQGCWHRPSVISLTCHCHEQTRRDHPGTPLHLTRPRGIVFHFITSVGLIIFGKHISDIFDLKNAQPTSACTAAHAEVNHSYTATRCNRV